MTDLEQRIAKLAPEKRAQLERELLRRAQAARQGAGDARALTPSPDRGALAPLSFAQERLWFVQQMDPRTTEYNQPHARRLRGRLDVDALRRAFAEVSARHDVLRTVYLVHDGQPMQRATDRVIELRVMDAPAALGEALAVEAGRPFDLAVELPYRVMLYRLAEDDHVLFTCSHHIVTDALSSQRFEREWTSLYNAFAQGEPTAQAPVAAQFADYARWQRAYMSGERLDRELAHWTAALKGAPMHLDLPSDRPRPADPSYRGGRITLPVPAELAERVRAFSRDHGATPFMTFLAAFQSLIARYTGRDDFLLGVYVSGRYPVETEGMLGCFINAVALRADTSGDPSFAEAVARARSASLDAFAHQHAPFEKVVEALRPQRETGRAPLVQVMFQLRPQGGGGARLHGLDSEPHPIEWRASAFDLSLDVVEGRDGGWSLMFEHSAELFDGDRVERMGGHLLTLLEDGVARPAERVSRLRLLTEGEVRRMLHDWNDTAAPIPEPALIHEQFRARARSAPDSVAVLDGARSITFGELDAASDALAGQLAARGAQPGDVVGVCLPRAAPLLVALLGALKAGAAYLPLDPSYPPERLGYMLANSRARLVITQADLAGLLGEAPPPMVLMDGVAAIPAPAEGRRASSGSARASDAEPAEGPNAAAYVIYTSGSTGKPKGVIGTHRGALNRFAWMWREHPFEPGEVCCQKTAISFVDSVWELFGPLLRGVPVVMIGDEAVKDVPRFIEALAEAGVTRLVLVPSLLRAMLDAAPDLGARLPKLRLWVSSGEALPATLARRFIGAAPGAALLNLYGSSEVAADVTCFDAGALPDGATGVPIGRPISNTRAFILDRFRQPVPVGVPGELYICGAGVALGYAHRPELTAERFVSLDEPLARLGAPPDLGPAFKTGDLARWRADGMIEYLGRADDQVKVRGFRVELGEVEAALRALPGVHDAAVAARGDGLDAQLVAYVVGDGAAPDASDARERLRRALPEHMLPARFVPMQALPLLPNGKVDRKALPEPDAQHAAAGGSIAPHKTIHLQLAPIWEEVLGVKGIGVHDDFFDLGGHSLLAVKLLARVEQAFGVKLALNALFTAPTLDAFANALHARHPVGVFNTVVPIQPRGSHTPFFCVHGFGGGVLNYVTLARALGPDQPFYAFKAFGFNGEGAPDETIEAMAERYIGAMKAVQPSGPYRVGGHCFGGVVAFEMARQLEAMGERVETLALIDAFTPEPANKAALAMHPARALSNAARWVRAYGPRFLAARARQLVRLQLRRARGNTTVQVQDVIVNAQDVPRDLVGLTNAEIRAIGRYRIKPYGGQVDLFRVLVQPLMRGYDRLNGWDRFSAGVRLHMVQGNHRSIVMDVDDARALAARLRARLDAGDGA